MWGNSVIRLPVTEAKFINKSSLSILLPGVIRRLGLKLNSEQKAGDIFVQPSYCQADLLCVRADNQIPKYILVRIQHAAFII